MNRQLKNGVATLANRKCYHTGKGNFFSSELVGGAGVKMPWIESNILLELTAAPISKNDEQLPLTNKKPGNSGWIGPMLFFGILPEHLQIHTSGFLDRQVSQKA